MRTVLLAALLLPVLSAQFGWLFRRDQFTPANTLSGVGVSRKSMSDAVLARRTELMIESQTFAIMRDPEALVGAERITKQKKLFDQASAASGLPSEFIAAIAFLESWGNPKAESPAGPKGMMQISHGTARSMGLRITYGKRYRTVVERKQVRNKRGKLVMQSRRRRVPYTVLVRDERLIPQRAVPAAARYLARLEQQYGGRDWAVWAYHCGEGCIGQVRSVAEREDIEKPLTVPKVFFGGYPGRNREVWEAIRYHMDRDYSPTYWFRIMRAQQLLDLYSKDRASFRKLYEEYRYRVNPLQRAPHRLSVWLTPDDLAYANCDDLKKAQGKSLVRAFDHPKYFGFTLAPAIGRQDPLNREYYLQASPAAIGTIAYIAYETRRLHDEMKTHGEKFVPLEITELVLPRDVEEVGTNGKGGVSHCSGQVFDIGYRNLPPFEREALEFILNDLGWQGYLGFVTESSADATYHVGAAPTARDFFTRVYQEAVEKARESD
jgi:hypothetical protein